MKDIIAENDTRGRSEVQQRYKRYVSKRLQRTDEANEEHFIVFI